MKVGLGQAIGLAIALGAGGLSLGTHGQQAQQVTYPQAQYETLPGGSQSSSLGDLLSDQLQSQQTTTTGGTSVNVQVEMNQQMNVEIGDERRHEESRIDTTVTSPDTKEPPTAGDTTSPSEEAEPPAADDSSVTTSP